MNHTHTRRVKPERTFWRDQALSLRHRKWGVSCAAVDLDFVLCEYTGHNPKAIIEYKNERAGTQHSSDTNYQVIAKLATNSDIPFFGCRYASNFTWFKVTSLNLYAKKYVPCWNIFNEEEYVTFLYELRGQRVVPDVLSRLKSKPY